MNIPEMVQPYLNALVTALVGLLATLLLAAITSLRSKVEAWLEARTSAAQREVLHRLAEEAYAFSEKMYQGSGGDDKLEAALQYVTARLNLDRMGLTGSDIRAAIEKAWTELDAKSRNKAA